MKKVILGICITFAFVFSKPISAQSGGKVDAYEAEQKLIQGNFEGALDDYMSLRESDPKNDSYNYNIAICYLNTNINKSKAIPYLETITRKPKYDPNALYLLARAYHYAYRFDEAIKTYTAFKQTGRGTVENLKDVDRQIQFCINAKELIKFPLNVTFENLGANVNSPYADYYPFVPNDESFIIYNSRKQEEGSEKVKDDGSFPATIYMSKEANGVFTKSKKYEVPLVKKEGEEEVIGLSGSGDMMLIYYTNEKGVGDIYMANNEKGKSAKTLEKLSENINSSSAEEIAACINNDGSVLYFASDRSGGLGGTDLYMSVKLPDGKWGPAQNLGPEINTPYNEDFPNLTPDGKTLYFSSTGHTTMGGYDIFKAEKDPITKKFLNPKNAGYPISTPEDDYNFRMASNGRYGYMAALRDGGLGDLDIYRVTFNDVEPQYSVILGDIISADSTQKLNFQDVFITVNDDKTHELIGTYLPNPLSGRFIMILVPGSTYDVTIEATGFKPINEKINILDKSSYRFEIKKDIKLNPEGYKNK
jgi:tetratricopeptide (TPR) repeat protein